MSEKADPLLELVVDTKQINREKLAELLKGKVLLDLRSDTFLLQQEARTRSSARQVVLLSLLAEKALSLLKEGLADALSPSELTIVTGLKGGTIRPVLKRLADEGLIVRVQQGYTVHNSAFARVAIALSNAER